MKKTGIFFGSTTGNTEGVAQQIQSLLGDGVELFEVANASKDDLEKFDNLIFGTSTWGMGDLQDDFDGFISEIESANLSGKTVAIFGCGDQESYSDTFVDGMGQIWEVVSEKGCNIIGQTSKEGYNHFASRAEVDGQFVGLAIDEDNQGSETETRVSEWVAAIKPLL
ncbi:MAG: flavodoxin [Bacteroidales bacterium]|nr:MAG: flavodoxin [Bacteroidales bacterium]